VLVPVDENFIKPTVNYDLDKSGNNKNAIYILVGANFNIKNLKIRNIVVNNDKCKTDYNVEQSLFGLLDKPRAVTITFNGILIGNGAINITFGYDYEGRHYSQVFDFITTNTSDEFVMTKYNEAELEINIENLDFYG
jgi:hypothetical protein